MAKIKEKINRIYKRYSQPIGKSELKDQADLEKFLKVIDWITTLGWALVGIVGVISLYFFITKEIM